MEWNGNGDTNQEAPGMQPFLRTFNKECQEGNYCLEALSMASVLFKASESGTRFGLRGIGSVPVRQSLSNNQRLCKKIATNERHPHSTAKPAGSMDIVYSHELETPRK